MEIGLIEAGDDFLDEVSSGTEMSSLSEQQRRFLRVVQTRPDVQYRLQVTVYPIISRHLSIHRKWSKWLRERERERSFYGDYENARDGREGVFVCVSVCVGSWKWRRGCVIRERNSTFPNFMRSLWNLEFVLFLSLSFFLSFFFGLIRYSNRLFLFFYSFTLPYVEVIKTFLSKNSQKSKVI